nr:hypothetical protein [Hepelivirales sp.]
MHIQCSEIPEVIEDKPKFYISFINFLERAIGSVQYAIDNLLVEEEEVITSQQGVESAGQESDTSSAVQSTEALSSESPENTDDENSSLLASATQEVESVPSTSTGITNATGKSAVLPPNGIGTSAGERPDHKVIRPRILQRFCGRLYRYIHKAAVGAIRKVKTSILSAFDNFKNLFTDRARITAQLALGTRYTEPLIKASEYVAYYSPRLASGLVYFYLVILLTSLKCLLKVSQVIFLGSYKNQALTTIEMNSANCFRRSMNWIFVWILRLWRSSIMLINQLRSLLDIMNLRVSVRIPFLLWECQLQQES